MSTQEVIDAALALPEAEKMRLLELLLEAVGPDVDHLSEEQFAAELQRRSTEIDNGTAELIPWSELKKQKF